MYNKPRYYVELHIEQGSVLESEGYDIGIPIGIVGLTAYEFKIKGQSSQAGPTPMSKRKDSLVGAAKVIAKIREYINAWEDRVRATVGIINNTPNVYNAIPGETSFTVDVRSINKDAREKAIKEIIEIAEDIAKKENLNFEYKHLWTADEVKFSPETINTIELACRDLELKYKYMCSWAGHDAQYITRISKWV